MLVHSIFFYFFSVIAIFSSLMVITSRNTVNSVFFLILDFISSEYLSSNSISIAGFPADSVERELFF